MITGLSQCICLDSEYSKPIDINHMQAIEKQQGRRREQEQRWGANTG